VLQPSKVNRQRRRSRIQSIQDEVNHTKGKTRSTSEHSQPLLGSIASDSGSEDGSDDSANSQLRDLVVEDYEAEEIERARARKEGSPRWNEAEPKHFVRTFPGGDNSEEVREGDAPDQIAPKQPHGAEHIHNLDQPLHENDEPEAEHTSEAWKHKDYDSDNAGTGQSEHHHHLDGFAEERDVWGEGSAHDSHNHGGR
jgi:hypothetical protein